MKKATISGSMRFIEQMKVLAEEAKELNIDAMLPNLNSDNMTDEELMQEHLAKIDDSDYLILANVDGYIEVSGGSELGYAIDHNKALLTITPLPESFNRNPLARIYNGATELFVYTNKTFMVPDDTIFTKWDSSIKDDDIHMIRLLSKPDIPNINGYTYSRDEFIKALSNNRVKELMQTGTFRIEYGIASDFISDTIRFQSIDPATTIGKLLAVGEKYLYLQSNNNFNKFIVCNDNKLIAGMRYMGVVDDKKNVSNINIITWNIWKLNEDTEPTTVKYLETL